MRNTWLAAVFIVATVQVVIQGVAPNSNVRSQLTFQRYHRRHITIPPCSNGVHDDNFSDVETKIRESEFVFTGKVTSEIQSTENKSNKDTEQRGIKFWVRVKRVLKGEVPLSVDPGHKSHQQMSVKIRTMDRQKAPRDCYKRPLRVHHTAIFLAKRIMDDSGELLQLTVDPLPLTLRNLDKVNAAVKDMTYKPRPPIIEEPCEKTYCAYGANCVQTVDGRAECQCPNECPPTFTPVCGTDGVTYTNHCVMRMKSCRQEKNTRVQHAGECDSRSPKRRHRG